MKPILDVRSGSSTRDCPRRCTRPQSARLVAIDRVAAGWLDQSIKTDKLNAKEWSTQEWLRFLRALPANLPTERLTDLDRAFGLTERGNAEIAHDWLLVAIKNGYHPADARLEAYLTTIGRRKLVLPLYQALIASRRRPQARRGDLRQSTPLLSSDHGGIRRQASQKREVTHRIANPPNHE